MPNKDCLTLRNCPFCGGEATTAEKAGITAKIANWGWVGCQKCRVFMEYTHGEKGKKLATEAWNRSVSDADAT